MTAVGGAALAAAADTMTSSSTRSSEQMRDGRPERQVLSSEIAARVRAAALDESPARGGRRPVRHAVHAHIRAAGGARRVVLVNAPFEATDVQADRSRGRGAAGAATVTATAAAAAARPR